MSKNSAKPRLLLVDDTISNIDVLVAGLKDEYQLSIALNGQDAIRSVQANPPALILLDIMMPEMDGHEVCRRLKAEKETQDIPVIFVTAMDEEVDETQGLKIGAVDYIHKPVSIAIVRERVKTHLSLRSVHQKLEKQNQQLIEAAHLREDIERISRHDLKQPLTSIIGAPRLVKVVGKVNSEQIKLLDLITTSGYRMLNMINQSLDLYKMERGIYQLEPVPFDLLAVVRKVLNEALVTAKEKDVTLSVKVKGKTMGQDDEFLALGEELLSYSMLSNLIKNAIEASPRGETVLTALDEEEQAMISVSNRGIVPEEIRERFFDKYITAGKKEGTGLGTYSARLMAETQGGAISLETSVHGETRIEICLPLPN